MPSVRSVQSLDTKIETIDKGGTKTLMFSTIPSAQNTVAKVENYINNTWVPANITGFQMKVHVISISPFSVQVTTADNDIIIPSNWWEPS